MSKIYYNTYYDRAIIINESEKTFQIKRVKGLKALTKLIYQATAKRLLEIKQSCLERGYSRA